MHIELIEGAPQSDLMQIEHGLTQHALDAGVEPRNYRPLHVLLRDEQQELAGGLMGSTVWGWLQVSLFWIREDMRGGGHGTRLLEVAESEARRRGCHHALLDTFDFQAREFYERLGYRAFATLDEFPSGHARHFLAKLL